MRDEQQGHLVDKNAHFIFRRWETLEYNIEGEKVKRKTNTNLFIKMPKNVQFCKDSQVFQQRKK